LKYRKSAHIPYILACHLQIDADPDPAYHFDADPSFPFQINADPCGSGSATLQKSKIFPRKEEKISSDLESCKLSNNIPDHLSESLETVLWVKNN
jgi:hypothetical protein